MIWDIWKNTTIIWQTCARFLFALISTKNCVDGPTQPHKTCSNYSRNSTWKTKFAYKYHIKCSAFCQSEEFFLFEEKTWKEVTISTYGFDNLFSTFPVLQPIYVSNDIRPRYDIIYCVHYSLNLCNFPIFLPKASTSRYVIFRNCQLLFANTFHILYFREKKRRGLSLWQKSIQFLNIENKMYRYCIPFCFSIFVSLFQVIFFLFLQAAAIFHTFW